jgi:hypothetical protein
MAATCQHTNATDSDHKDSGAHIVYCPDCKSITHVCFKPIYDHVEKAFEVVRTWGVAFSKMGERRASDAAAIQREMEALLVNLREAVLMARVNKNEFIEQVATLFEERGQRDVAASIRDLKMEVSIKGAQHVPASA